jgi:hypothetical protein
MHHRRYHFDILIPGNSSMASAPNPSIRRTRGLPRRDHKALHNGLLSSPSERSEESTCGTGRPYSPEPSPSRNTEDTPRTKQSYSLPSSSPFPLDPTISESRSNTSSPHPYKRRKTKSYSNWTIEHIWTTDLDSTWCRQGGPLKKDRLLICKHCSWSSRDSSRYGSTSNLLVHLQTKHRIKSGADSIFLPAVEGNLDRFLESPRKKVGVEEMLIRWVSNKTAFHSGGASGFQGTL